MSKKREPEKIDGVEYWRCAKCEGLKLHGEFHYCSQSPAGIYNYCKTCQREIANRFYHRTKKAAQKSAKV